LQWLVVIPNNVRNVLKETTKIAPPPLRPGAAAPSQWERNHKFGQASDRCDFMLAGDV
jgi:hypothetical protein